MRICLFAAVVVSGFAGCGTSSAGTSGASASSATAASSASSTASSASSTAATASAAASTSGHPAATSSAGGTTGAANVTTSASATSTTSGGGHSATAGASATTAAASTSSTTNGGSSSTGSSGATGNFYVYTNGVTNALWQTDYSFGTAPTENKMETTHPQSGHTYDFSFGNGAWQPGSTNYGGAGGFGVGPFGWDISPYTYMVIDLWPSDASDQYDTAWHYDGDVTTAQADLTTAAYIPDITDWAGPITNNQWNHLKFPLAAVGQLGNQNVYKFFFRDNTNSTPTIYLDNVGFVPGNLAWVYSGGSGPASGWADASSGATANYAYLPTDYNADLVSLNGITAPGTSIVSTNAIALSVTSAGGMLKISNSSGFSIATYDHLTFGAVPTKSGYAYSVQLYDTTGAAIGNAVDPSTHTGEDWGTSTQYWTIYCIPLSAFGSIGTTIGGLSIKDASGAATNTVYFSAIGFYD